MEVEREKKEKEDEKSIICWGLLRNFIFYCFFLKDVRKDLSFCFLLDKLLD